MAGNIQHGYMCSNKRMIKFSKDNQDFMRRHMHRLFDALCTKELVLLVDWLLIYCTKNAVTVCMM